MTSLEQIRTKYPQYADMSDGDLLIGLHRKHYSDMHPREFLNSVEGAANAHVTIKNPELKTWYRDRVSQPLPGEDAAATEKRLSGLSYDAPSGGRLMAGMRSGLQGATFGYGDEIVGNLRAMTSGNSPEYEVGQERARLSAGEEEYPAQSAVAEVGGAMATPGAAVTSPAKAVAAGTLGGSLYASGKAEGGLEERTSAAINAAPESALFSAGGVIAQRGLSKGFEGLVRRAKEKPSGSALKAVRDKAYEAVDNSGFTFTKDQFDNALTEIYRRLDDPSSAYVKGDPKVERALKVLEKNWGNDLTLGQLDNVRKRLMKTWASAGPDEADAILDIVDVVNDLIDGSGGGPLMQTAREAHKTYMRVDFLEKAFQKAENATSVSGSGGNSFNNYARVFKNILADEKKAKIFSPEMREFMQKAIDTPVSENTMRKIGKLSPDGNGLMLALSVIGGSIDPTLFAVSGVGAGAKVISEKKMAAQVDAMMRLAAGLPARPATRTRTNIITGAAVAGQQDN